MSLTFDPATHTYRWAGVVVQSVTQILEQAFRSFAAVEPEVLQRAQLRGTNVHLMCQFHDEDCLDESQFTGEELAYLPGWKRFLADHQPNWTAIEVPFYNEIYGYPGTPDRMGTLESGTFRGAECCIDIKTSWTKSVLWALQTAGYCQGTRRHRFTVQLKSDGRYRLLEWSDPMDWPVFVSLLTLNRWTRMNNL
jgi:hypothetical protein